LSWNLRTEDQTHEATDAGSDNKSISSNRSILWPLSRSEQSSSAVENAIRWLHAICAKEVDTVY